VIRALLFGALALALLSAAAIAQMTLMGVGSGPTSYGPPPSTACAAGITDNDTGPILIDTGKSVLFTSQQGCH
jgi:hypothetical protein